MAWTNVTAPCWDCKGARTKYGITCSMCGGSGQITEIHIPTKPRK